MKKVISIALILVFLFSLGACSKSTSSGSSSPAASGTSTPGSSSPAASGTSTPGSSAPASKPSTQPVAENKQITVRIGIPGDLGDLISSGSQGDCYAAIDAVFDVIFFCDPETREWKSNVLESWQMEGANSMVLKMRKDIVFSNGDKATAEDLLYSYLCHLDDGNDHWIKAMKIRPAECKIRDDYTVVIAVDEKSQDFFSRDNKLLDKKWVDKVGWKNPEAWYKPVGSGPYYVADNKPGDSITLKLRDSYWLRPVKDYYVNQYVITHYADTTTAEMALEVGDIDFCKVGKSEYSRVVKDGKAAGLDVTKISTGVTTNFYMPAHINKVWDNKLVREAVAYGVNWVELDKIMYGELSMPATSVTPSDSPLYINPGTRTYDLEKAKKLLAEAGFKPGDITIKTSLFDTAVYKSFGEAITHYLSQIGIKADISYGDTATVLAVWNAGKETDFAMHVNPAGSPGRNICQSIPGVTGENVSFTKVENAKLKELWAKLSPLYDAPVNDKKAIAKDLQQLVYDEILIIPFHEDNVAIAFNAKVLSKDIMQRNVTAETNYKLSRLGLRSNWK